METTQPFSQPPVRRPKNWLVESILVTIFCCLPLGIVGIVNAAQVNGRYDRGDYEGALDASKQAGRWTKIGFFASIIAGILYLILVFVFGLGSLNPYRSSYWKSWALPSLLCLFCGFIIPTIRQNTAFFRLVLFIQLPVWIVPAVVLNVPFFVCCMLIFKVLSIKTCCL